MPDAETPFGGGLLGGCVALPGDTAVASWTLAPGQEVGPTTRELGVLVTRVECNSGVTGQVEEPKIEVKSDRMIVTFVVTPGRVGSADCQGNSEVAFSPHASRAARRPGFSRRSVPVQRGGRAHRVLRGRWPPVRALATHSSAGSGVKALRPPAPSEILDAWSGTFPSGPGGSRSGPRRLVTVSGWTQMGRSGA